VSAPKEGYKKKKDKMIDLISNVKEERN